MRSILDFAVKSAKQVYFCTSGSWRVTNSSRIAEHGLPKLATNDSRDAWVHLTVWSGSALATNDSRKIGMG